MCLKSLFRTQTLRTKTQTAKETAFPVPSLKSERSSDAFWLAKQRVGYIHADITDPFKLPKHTHTHTYIRNGHTFKCPNKNLPRQTTINLQN